MNHAKNSAWDALISLNAMDGASTHPVSKGPERVRSGKTRSEHMSSEMPLIADVGR